MKRINIILSSIVLLAMAACQGGRHTSPDGTLALSRVDSGFVLTKSTHSGEVKVIEIPQAGVVTARGRGERLELKRIRKAVHEVNYTMLGGKRRECSNKANEYTYVYVDSTGGEVRMIFRLYDDGLAFRYEIDGLADDLVTDEHTVYRIDEGRRRWIQKFELGYEEFYHPHTTPDPHIKHWIYPALVEQEGGVYTLITEANIRRGHSASSLWNEEAGTDYKVTLARNEGERYTGDWVSPWRLLITGSLADVVESTLVTDVSDESLVPDAAEWVQPGPVSWVYWAHNRGSKDFQIVSQYIDLADSLDLPYVLIDWEWDVMGNGGDIEDAIAKAKEAGVRPLVWYNSSTAWTAGAAGPLYRLNKPEDREREFAWLAGLGVAGVKIDFFDGDTRATMDYCIDLLESAARHHLLVNFHGATIPRGWQRTYPNMMSVEAVYGAEWYNNNGRLTPVAATHNATLPFTRNVIGPMDYTPCTFSDSQHPHLTTHAHELALTVLYESALQHLADRPESYLAQPDEVKRFFSQLPTVWDDTKLLSGYPGKWVAMARRAGDKWYVGVVNGLDTPQHIDMDWSFLGEGDYTITTFGDVEGEAHAWDIDTEASLPDGVNLAPRGGFVAVIASK